MIRIIRDQNTQNLGAEHIPSLLEALRVSLVLYGFGEYIYDELPLRILKYIYLKNLDFSTNGEKSIADHIGIHGQPKANDEEKGALLNLSYQQLTSLKGLSLVREAERIHDLNIGNNYIFGSKLDIDFPYRPFSNLTNIRKLNLSNNQFHTIPDNIFNNLIHLTTLYLSENQLTKLTPGQFKDLNNLSLLSLARNKLTHLGKDQFKNLIALEHLTLAHNLITYLDSTQFSQQKKLISLNLSHNRIHYLNPHVFRNLTLLSALYLNDNLLKEISNLQFTSLTKLTTLNVERNYLQETKDQFIASHQLPQGILTFTPQLQ